jgi:hypothetical protein
MRLKKMPAARKPAEMAALTRPARSHPRCMLMAALKNQAAAPTYQIQLKLRPTFFEMRPAGGTILLDTGYSDQRSAVRKAGTRLVAGSGWLAGKRMRFAHDPHLPKPGRYGAPRGFSAPWTLPPTPRSSAVLPSLFPWVRVRTGSELRALELGQPYAGRGPGSWPSGTQTLRAGTHSASL